MPKVSVIIPTYRRTHYLEETLKSIMAQTYQDFEIIVVDDGTPNDCNEAVCKVFEKVNYFKIKNSGGPSKPRNFGIRKAQGKYIAFVDDDDLWQPEKLEKQVAILESNPDFGLAHSYCKVIDEKGNVKNEIVGRPGNPTDKHGNVSLKMMGNWTVMMPTSFIRKEIVDKVGFFNEKMPAAGEDAEFWIRCSFFTDFYYIDEPLVLYRIHSNNISSRAKGYADLSVYLRKILTEYKSRKIIGESQYKLLLNSLCGMQLKMIKKYSFRSVINLFKLNPFWIFHYKNLKLLGFVLIKR